MSANEITSVTAGTSPVTGEDVYQIEYADGELQNHRGSWAEARELAHRAGLEGREDGPVGVTRWFRRGLTLVALLVVALTACCPPPRSPDSPTSPPATAVLIPPASCRQTPTGPVCNPAEVGPDPSTPSKPG